MEDGEDHATRLVIVVYVLGDLEANRICCTLMFVSPETDTDYGVPGLRHVGVKINGLFHPEDK